MANKTICVTGAAGYLGSWVVKILLERGYNVRATIRSLASAEHLNKYSLAPNSNGTLELHIADLLINNSYDNIINGCDVVIHCASPFLIKKALENPQKNLIDPAVNGIVNVLSSVNKADSVKHVVITSSIAAITIAPSETKIFDEKDWAVDANIYDSPYQLSKFMAEDTAWKIYKQQQRWHMSSICPSFIIGPTLSSRVNDGSISTIIDLLTGKYFFSPKFSMSYVDVRDVAECHVLAFEKSNITSGQRYLCCEETLYLKQLGQLLDKKNKRYLIPRYEVPNIFFKYFPFLLPFRRSIIDKVLGIPYMCSNAKIKHDLNIHFTPIKKSFNDMVQSMLKFKLIK